MTDNPIIQKAEEIHNNGVKEGFRSVIQWIDENPKGKLSDLRFLLNISFKFSELVENEMNKRND